jgi:hypothetical protein
MIGGKAQFSLAAACILASERKPRVTYLNALQMLRESCVDAHASLDSPYMRQQATEPHGVPIDRMADHYQCEIWECELMLVTGKWDHAFSY